MTTLRPIIWRLVLALWTIGIWGSRLRNIVADDDLEGSERVVALGIAAGFVVLGAALLTTVLARRPWHRPILGALVGAGIVRWTIRGPIILASDEWEVGFKVVHTILWLITVALSVAAWRERDTI